MISTMQNLKGSDRFRQLLQKFNQPKQGSGNVQLNHDTNVRKSNRETKKPVKYNASPYITTAKEPKRRGRSVERNNKSTERRNKSGERSDTFGGHKGRSRERVTDKDSGSPVLSRPKRHDLREEGVIGMSPPQRSTTTRVLPSVNQRSSDLTYHTLQEPVSQSQLYSQRVGMQGRREECTKRHEESYIPEPKRQGGFESDFRPDRRREPEYEVNQRPEKRLADTYLESGVFARPQPVSSDQSRWRPNASRNDYYGTIRQPFVRLEDIAKSRENAHLLQSRMNLPHSDLQQPTMWTKEQSMRHNSRTAQLPLNSQQRFDGDFLRPATPPGTAELAQKEESEFLDALSKFSNSPLFSPIEVIFLLNNLENTLVRKMSRCIRSNNSAQSALRMTMIENATEVSSRTHMVQDWLKTNNSGAPPRQVDDQEVHSKRMGEPFEREYVKKMRVAAGEDNLSYQRAREPHAKLSASVLKRMEDRRRMDSTTPISHME